MINVRQYWLPPLPGLEEWPLAEPYAVYSCGATLTLFSGFDPKLLETREGQNRVIQACATARKIWIQRIKAAIERGAI